MQTLPRELSLPEDGVLRIQPLRELAQLREAEQREADVTVSPGALQVLSSISGDALELAVTLEPAAGARCGVVVYADADGTGGLPVTVSPQAGTLSLGDVRAPLSLAEGEAIQLRVFLDKNVVEVFANDRQAMVASHFATPGHLSIALTSEGGDTRASDIRGWEMKSIY
jgi:beta-fructofuranosidase